MAGLSTFWVDHAMGDCAEAREIRVQQIAALVRHTGIIAAANIINSALVVIVFWPLAPSWILLSWAALLWGMTVFRLVKWRRRPHGTLNRPSTRAFRRASLWAIVAGALWGGAAAILFSPTDSVLQVFLAFICGGMAAGAATTLATVPPAAIGYIGASMTPLIGAFVLSGGRVQVVMAGMLLLFSVLMLFVARSRYLGFLDSVRMRVANAVLMSELQAARDNLLDAIESLGESFMLFDRDDRMVLCNGMARQHLAPIADRLVPGLSFRELCALTWDHGLVRHVDMDRDTWIEWRVRNHQQAAAPIERRVAEDSWLWITERRTRGGGIAMVGADISPLKLAQRALEQARAELEQRIERRTAELREAKDAAERANAAKSRFLAAASHDLRLPLQAQVLLHGVLANRNRDPALESIIAKLGRSLGAQQQLLNALLDMSRLEAGIVAVEKTVFAIDPLLDRLAAEFAVEAEAAGLALRRVPCRALVHSDRSLLDRILRNLLANALKYTGHGSVLLGCRPAGANLRIQVWDTGSGIPQDQIQVIFEEFHQLDNPARDRHKGLGLGLAIVDRLVRLLGHRITVRSVVGRGTVFTVEVPRAGAAPVVIGLSGASQEGAEQDTGSQRAG